MRAGEERVDTKRRSPHLSSRLHRRWAVTHYIYSGAAQRAALIAAFHSDRCGERVCERVSLRVIHAETPPGDRPGARAELMPVQIKPNRTPAAKDGV